MKNTISLNRNEMFLNVYKKGKRAYSKVFVLHYLQNGKNFNRLGIKVPKKVAKAVKRNRIRRLLKESYRLREDCIRTGYDIVFSVKENADCCSCYAEVSDAVNNMLSRAKLFEA